MEPWVKPPRQNIERSLVTILAADFASFSAHMADDEERTARTLKAHRAVIDGIIASHKGRIFNTAGDSVLAEFSSPLEAVRGALEIQEALKTSNGNLEPDARMVLRIGINLGDVLVEGTNLIGDAVNIAARLESLAEPGGVIVSGAVYDQVASKVDWGFYDLGTPPLKNISRPIRVLAVSQTLRRPRVMRKLRLPPFAALSVLAMVAATGAGAALWWSVARTPNAQPSAGDQPANAYLAEEPPMGKLGQGVRVLVDDRTCPDGEIKEVVGGNFYWPDGTKKKEGTLRTRRCIPR